MSVIVLTAGHSATDPGAMAGDYTEAALMLELRDLTADMLRGYGHTVIEDGEDGENLPLKYATSLIRQGALAIELHTNGVENPAARGVEAISLADKRPFAQALAQRVAQALNTRVRGNAGWIDQAQTPRGRLGYVGAGGVILETFFISNPEERARYLGDPQTVAEAIADVVDEWAS
mgnify:CR=1 FL=1